MRIRMGIEGSDQLDAALRALPDRVGKRVIKKGIVAMGRHFVLEMRKEVNKKTDGQGDTARSIKNSSGGLRQQFVRINSPVWHLLEYGTDNRFQRSGKFTGRISDNKFSFVRPVLFREADKAKANFEIRVRSEIEKLGVSLLP